MTPKIGKLLEQLEREDLDFSRRLYLEMRVKTLIADEAASEAREEREALRAMDPGYVSPGRIEALEAQVRALQATLEEALRPAFQPAQVDNSAAIVAELRAELERAGRQEPVPVQAKRPERTFRAISLPGVRLG